MNGDKVIYKIKSLLQSQILKFLQVTVSRKFTGISKQSIFDEVTACCDLLKNPLATRWKLFQSDMLDSCFRLSRFDAC